MPSSQEPALGKGSPPGSLTETLSALPLSPGGCQLLGVGRSSVFLLQAALLRVHIWLLSRLVLVASAGMIGRGVKGVWNGKRYFIRCNYFLGSLKTECSLSFQSQNTALPAMNAVVPACSTHLRSSSDPSERTPLPRSSSWQIHFLRLQD